MESNKGESQKCLAIAKAALLIGDLEKASKFLNKSNKLYPLKEAEAIAARIKTSQSKGPAPQKKTQSMPDFSELHGSSSEATPKYTPKQKDLVDKVNRSKDYYEILSVPKDASETDLKKAYRKMALQLHPDKNAAPGATDAFKSVGKAYSVLSNASQRKRYDLYGPEEATRRHYRNSSDDEYEADFDPNDIFNMFFGGGFPNENVRVFRQGNTYYYENRRPRQRHAQHENSQQGNPILWIQLLPVLIIFLLTLAGNLFVSDPVYSFARKGDYSYSRRTENMNVPYYVKRDFGDTYRRGTASLMRLEESIEAEFVENLRERCYQERINKENTRRKGIYFGSSEMVKRAEAMTAPSCEKLEKIFSRGQ